MTTDPPDTDHLTPELMERAQRRLVAKALAEASHERMIAPEEVSPGRYRVATEASAWTFAARVLELEHWLVDAASIERTRDGVPAPVDAQALVAEMAGPLGIPDDLLPVYLEELASTLASS
ncbi:MAG TPA: hypothetical protein VF728_05390, partial [Nocardioides sp.]